MTTISSSSSQSNGVPMTTRQSPSELQNSMLLALATAIPSPRGDVSTDGAIEAMCHQLGITVGAWGVVESQASKPNWTRYNGVRAIRFLDASGYIKKPKRGRYGLTQKGWDKATDLGYTSTQTVVTPSRASDSINVVTEQVTEQVASGSHGTGTGLSFEDLFSQLEDTYHDDEYIVGLAIEQTNCFGFHAERSPTCRTCPLAKSCKKSWLVDLTEVALELDKGNEPLVLEDEPVEVVKGTVEGTVVEDKPLSSDDPHAFKRVDGVTYTSVISPIDTTCTKCGKAIPQGASGTSQWGQVGVFCPEHLID